MNTPRPTTTYLRRSQADCQNDPLQALGRNGYIHVAGLCVSHGGSGLPIVLAPLTSRGVPGRCIIELDRRLAAKLAVALLELSAGAEGTEPAPRGDRP